MRLVSDSPSQISIKSPGHCEVCHITVAPFDPDRRNLEDGKVAHSSCLVKRLGAAGATKGKVFIN